MYPLSPIRRSVIIPNERAFLVFFFGTYNPDGSRLYIGRRSVLVFVFVFFSYIILLELSSLPTRLWPRVMVMFF